MRNWHTFVVCLVFFIFGLSLMIPIITKREPYEPIEDNPLPSDDPDNSEPYIFEETNIPENSFGFNEPYTKKVNGSYFKQLFNAHTDWLLRYKLYEGDDWHNGNDYLSIDKTWIDDHWKINLTFTAPRDVYLGEFIFGIDLPCLDYVERSGNEVWVNYSANTTENYSVYFNWDDLASVPGLIFDKGRTDNKFWFSFKKYNIPEGEWVFDPTFGYSSGSNVEPLYDYFSEALAGAWDTMGAIAGTADNIIVKFGSLGGTKDYQCAIYEYVDYSSSYAGNLVGVTETKEIADNLDNTEQTFFFSDPKPSLSASTKYYLCVRAAETGSIGVTNYVTTEAGSGYGIEIYGTGGPYAFNNPLTGESSENEYPWIYCTYTEVSSEGWNNITEGGGTWDDSMIISNDTVFISCDAWNGSVYNYTSFLDIESNNGSIFNNTIFSEIESWSGEIYNTTKSINLESWNGSIYNSTIFVSVESINGSIFNGTAGWINVDSWNGSIYNFTGFSSIDSWEGLIRSVSDWTNITWHDGVVEYQTTNSGNCLSHNKLNVQTFTTGTNGIDGPYEIYGITLYMRKHGSPGYAWFSIQGVNPDGTPDGINITSGVIDASLISTSYTYQFINMSHVTLDYNTNYTIRMWPTSSNSSSNYIDIRIRDNADVYTGGERLYSDDFGTTWTHSTHDFWFQINGYIKFNGSIYNTTDFILINQINGSIYNKTKSNTVDQLNGSVFNNTVFNNMESWNGSIWNLSVFGWNNILFSVWNGSIFNISTIQSIESWNGSIYNISEWNTPADINGSIYNNTLYVNMESINGSIYNSSMIIILDSINGSIYNISSTRNIEDWNGSVFDTTSMTNIESVNGSIFNNTVFATIESINGSIFNNTIFNIIESINGTIYNDTCFGIIESWNGSVWNITATAEFMCFIEGVNINCSYSGPGTPDQYRWQTIISGGSGGDTGWCADCSDISWTFEEGAFIEVRLSVNQTGEDNRTSSKNFEIPFSGENYTDPDNPDEFENRVDCELNGFYWYDGCCHNESRPYPWNEPDEHPEADDGILDIIFKPATVQFIVIMGFALFVFIWYFYYRRKNGNK